MLRLGSRKENQGGVGKGECARLPGFLRGRRGRVEGCQAAVGKQHRDLAGQASVQVVHVPGSYTHLEGGTVIAQKLDMGTASSGWTGTLANGKQARLNPVSYTHL